MADKQLKIAVTGKMRAGKDTFAGCLKQSYPFIELKFSDGITDIIKAYFPEALQHGKPRQHYQVIGQSFRQLNADIWVNRVGKEIAEVEAILPNANFLVTDLRQPNEAEFLRENGFVIVKVVADKAVRLQRMQDENDSYTADDLQHETETNVDEIVADFTVYNDGDLTDLHEQKQQFLDWYRLLREVQ